MRGLAALTTALLLAGCASNPPSPEASAPVSPTLAATTAPPAPRPAPPSPGAGLGPSFGALASGISATIGVAVVPVGGGTATQLGDQTPRVAWSTIKVPLAIAALRANHGAAEGPASRAITQSDNAAAEQLWSQLGTPEQAKQQVEAVLREKGDPTTQVQSQRVRPEFTPFGQTYWPLASAAQFAANLSCRTDPDTAQVLDWMANLSAGAWGLAAHGPSKGGWGPGQAGGYLVRQIAVLPTDHGPVGVALAADAGSFDAGVSAVNQVAQWLVSHQAELPGGQCAG